MRTRHLCNFLVDKLAGTQGRRDAGTQGRRDAGTQGLGLEAATRVILPTFALLSLFTPCARAQLLPPPPATATKWHTLNSGDWATAAHWSPATIPDSGADVLFAGPSVNSHAAQVTVTTNANSTLKSLWFDGGRGIDYTLTGTGTLTLGQDLPSEGHLITVLSSIPAQAHINIEVPITLDNSIANRYFRIQNYSLGGLRLSGPLLLGNQHLKIDGTGVTHIAGNLSSLTNTSTFHAGNIYLTNPVPIAGAAAPPTQLILSGDNSAWTGGLYLDSPQTMAIFRNPLAMRPAGPKMLRAQNGSSFVLRGGGTYGADRMLNLGGLGAVRQAQAVWGIGALYYDGGGETTYNGAIQLGAHTRVGARGDAGGLTLAGQISGNYWFSKVGPGLVTLTNSTNYWLGGTEIWAGVLRITNNTTIANTIHLKGGILELAYGTTTHNFALKKVQWGEQFGLYPDGGGFSAYGGNRTVTIAGGATLTWGQGGMVGDGSRLLLSSRYADSVITLTNPINLGSASREIRVEHGSPNAYAVLTGAITGTGGIIKTGPGLLHLTATNNPYTGPTLIREGALRGNIPPHSNIQLNGGVLGLDGGNSGNDFYFIRSLGSGAGQIAWASGGFSGGGFAAYGGDANVTLNGGATLTYGQTPYFVGSNRTLAFGHYTATGTVIWNNPIHLPAGQLVQRMAVTRGAINGVDVVLNAAISSPFSATLVGGVMISGNGRMDIAVANPNLYGSGINIRGTEVRLNKEGSFNSRAHDWKIIYGGILTLDNVGTHKSQNYGGSYNGNRIHDNSKVWLAAGTIRYVGQWSGVSQERMGQLILQSGANIIELRILASGASNFAEVKFSSLLKSGFGTTSTLNYITDNSNFSKSRVSFVSWSSINTVGGIIPWSTINGKDLARPVRVTGGATELRPITSYTTGSSNWSASANVHNTIDRTFSVSTTINSLKLDNTTLTIDTESDLVINSGGLLTYMGNPTLTGTGRVLSGTGRPLYAHIHSNTLTIQNNLKFETGSSDFVKTGPGTLILDSHITRPHSFRDLYIHQGTVDLRQGAISARTIYIGDGAGRDILILPANRTDPLLNKPNITLHGTPYGLDSSNVYGGEESDQAILRLSGNTRQHIGTLRIEAKGTIDFAGGEAGLPNMLWVDILDINPHDSIGQLFLRNWYEKEDYFLVRKANFQQNDYRLSYIIFDGYQDYTVLAQHYDKDYWQITPFSTTVLPEPTTYGVVFGTVGLGLFAWRRRRRAHVTAR